MKKTVYAFLSFCSFAFVLSLLLVLQTSFVAGESEVGFDYDIEEGELYVDIVDGITGEPEETPIVDFGEGAFSSDPIVADGILGTEEQSVRVFNYTSIPGWELNIAAENVENEWSSDTDSYSYNHASDPELGRLTVDPSVGSMFSDVECDTTHLSIANEATFEYGVVDSIDLMSASPEEAPTFCRFDLRDVALSQIVPGAQPVGVYSLGMVLTVTAVLPEQTHPDYLQQSENTGEIEAATNDADNYFFVTEAPFAPDWTEYSSDPEIWLDNSTGLYWSEFLGHGTATWNDAVNGCASLDHGGIDDWRLPTRDELMQAAPQTVQVSPVCNECYQGHGLSSVSSDSFSTMEQYSYAVNTSSNPDMIWYVNLHSGYVGDWYTYMTIEETGYHCVARD